MGPVKWFEYIVATLGGIAAGGILILPVVLVWLFVVGILAGTTGDRKR